MPAACIAVRAGYSEPESHFRLRVRSGRKTHTVAWVDTGGPDAVADRFRALLADIVQMFGTRPEVMRLPEPLTICL